MKIKESFSYRCFTVFNTFFLTFLSVIMLYPMLYVAFASFSNPDMFLRHEGLLLYPLAPNLDTYKRVLENSMIWTGYKNTLIILVGATSLNMVLTIISSFVLSRKNLAYGPHIMKFIVFTMYFSGGLIPSYLNVRSFGLDNTLLALIIPGAISATNMIILKSAFASIPDSLEESATLDGANPFTIMTKIIVPLSGPSIAVIVLYYAVGHWNAWFGAMIYLRDRAKYPLQLVLREILIQNNTVTMMNDLAVDQSSIAETLKYAVIMVSTVPILAAYPLLQKYFVKGVMVGAVKG